MRLFQRSVLLCLLIALGTWLFFIGREHQVFLDNKTIEVEGKSFKALKLVRITVEGQPSIKLMPRDRDLIKIVGPSFKLRVEVMDEFGEEVEKTYDLTLNPGFAKDMMLCMPLLAAGRVDYILPPPTVQQSSEPDEAPSAASEGLPLLPLESPPAESLPDTPTPLTNP